MSWWQWMLIILGVWCVLALLAGAAFAVLWPRRGAAQHDACHEEGSAQTQDDLVA